MTYPAIVQNAIERAPFPFNEQQKEAVYKAYLWYRGWADKQHNKQFFFLSGYAGVGKSSVATTIAELCVPPSRLVYIAPTGRAAARLRQKGAKFAKTLHQFIYNVAGENEEGDPIFSSKGVLEEDNGKGKGPLLVVCDEGSMLGERDNRNLLSHRIPVLILGDTGQLPPVKDNPAYHEGNVDYQLTQIMRQTGESNIIRASMFIRQGKRLPVKEYDDVHIRPGKPTDADLVAHSGEDGQVLCSTNATRVEMNRRIRWALGFGGDMPMVGEKLVCTSNQHEFGFMNGEQGIVLGLYPPAEKEFDDDDAELWMVDLKSLSTGKEIRVKFNPESFSKKYDEKMAAQKSKGGFDFGYCVTIHKSQGSEWSKILIVEETIRGDYAKAMYTAVTRAMDELTIFRGD